jgi:hypothetical protein
MPMLRSCSFPDCQTLTLSPYCLEHEQLIVGLESDPGVQGFVRDEPMARDVAGVVVQQAPAA